MIFQWELTSLCINLPASFACANYEHQPVEAKDEFFTSFYQLDGLDAEIEIWYKMWMDNKLTEEELRDLDISELIKEAECLSWQEGKLIWYFQHSHAPLVPVSYTHLDVYKRQPQPPVVFI